MKRIIFSIYTDIVDEHTSATDFKREQFQKYKNSIIESHKWYAKLCNADYELLTTSTKNYNDIQFEKIFKLEKLSQEYDEVLYIDFDVIPSKNISFFDRFDLNKISIYNIPTKMQLEVFRHNTENNNWHSMDMYSKSCCKNAMLSLDGFDESSYCMNTGVIGANKNSIEELKFSDRLNECVSAFEECKVDNVYPDEMSQSWIENNEVFLSYIIERFKVSYTNIGLQWNFILDNNYKIPSDSAYFFHCVNKRFDLLLT